MKKFFLLLVLMFCGIFINAQDELTNLQKYWHYRYRLVNYYMVVGEGPGMSLPADIRNHYGNTLRWGEAPIYLGYYIGVLATEYRLLKDNGQNTDRTLTELYYALKAAIRIDDVAEASWNKPNDVNGFLIRDDVPGTFVQDHYAQLNYNILPNQGIIFGSGEPGEVTTTASDYFANSNNGTPENNAVSQDVIYELLVGFALVKQCVDVGPISFDNYITNSLMSVDLRLMALNETASIITYFKQNNLGPVEYHWELRDPNGAHVVGGQATLFCHALARAGNFITGIDFTDNISEGNPNEPLWQSLQVPNNILCDPISNQASVHHMGMVLAAISNSWKNVLSGANTTPNSLLANGDYDAGGFGGCSYFDNHFGWDVFYGSLWDVLHGGQTFICDLCKARDILNSAFWDGPFHHNVADKAYPGWCATRRFIDDPPRQNNGKSNFDGNYNGLDYMLLFNLYHLDARQQATPFYVPQNNPFVSDHYPYFNGNSYTGNISDPTTLFSPTYPVIVNQLSVTANSGPYPGIGDFKIYGGPQGVLLSNTSVENQAHLDISCTEVNSNCTPLQGYFFDPSYYQRVGSAEYANAASSIPPYTMEGEFKAQLPFNSFSISPIPANQNMKFSFSILNEASCSIYIYDVAGKKILDVYENSNQSKGISEINISTVDIPSGIYFCVFNVGGVKCEVRKIIIAH